MYLLEVASPNWIFFTVARSILIDIWSSGSIHFFAIDKLITWIHRHTVDLVHGFSPLNKLLSKRARTGWSALSLSAHLVRSLRSIWDPVQHLVYCQSSYTPAHLQVRHRDLAVANKKRGLSLWIIKRAKYMAQTLIKESPISWLLTSSRESVAKYYIDRASSHQVVC